jgi:hypothetical protein
MAGRLRGKVAPSFPAALKAWARAALLLASDEASFVNGAHLFVETPSRRSDKKKAGCLQPARRRQSHPEGYRPA